MIAVIVCFVLCWTVPSVTGFFQLLGVSMYTTI